MFIKIAMEPLVPRVSHRVYKITSPDGYHYIGITQLSEENCLKNHSASELMDSCLHRSIRDGTATFEVLEEITTKIGGQKLSHYELNYKLNEHLKLYFGNPLCVNRKLAVGLDREPIILCECGGRYRNSHKERHKISIKHRSFYEKDSSSD